MITVSFKFNFSLGKEGNFVFYVFNLNSFVMNK